MIKMEKWENAWISIFLSQENIDICVMSLPFWEEFNKSDVFFITIPKNID